MKKFYTTVFKILVLSEEPDTDNLGLDDLADYVNEGPGVLHTYLAEDSEEVSGKEMADLLYEAGSEPGFFQLDDDGNEEYII